MAATGFWPEPAHARTAPALAVQPHQQEPIDQLKAAYQSYPRAGAHRDTATPRTSALACAGVAPIRSPRRW